MSFPGLLGPLLDQSLKSSLKITNIPTWVTCLSLGLGLGSTKSRTEKDSLTDRQLPKKKKRLIRIIQKNCSNPLFIFASLWARSI